MALPVTVRELGRFQGKEGEKGDTGTLAFATAESVPAGEAAAVEMVGPESNRGAHFRVPRGLPGLNAVPADEGVGTLIDATDTATRAAFRRAAAESRGTVVDEEHATLEDALDATPVGGVLEIRQAHSRSATFEVDKTVTVRFVREGRIEQTAPAGVGMLITADDVTVESPWLVGTGSASPSTGAGLRGEGCSGLLVATPRIEGWSQYGIVLSLCSDFLIAGGRVYDVSYAGVMLLSCTRGRVSGVEVDTVVQPGSLPQSYGFAATRLSAESITTHPNSSEIVFESCVARNVTKWEGFDTHGGRKISWINCRAINCYHGFAAVGAPDKFSVPEYPGWAPRDILIQGCLADSTVTDGSRGAGLQLAGVNVTAGTAHEYATGIIQGLTIIGHGDVNNGNQGGTYIHTTKGLQINGLTAVDCSPHGLLFLHTNHDFVVSNVIVVDPWRAVSTGDAPVGIAFRSIHNRGTLSGATVYRGSKSAVNVLGYGIRNWQNNADTSVGLSQIVVSGAGVGPMLNPGNRMGQMIDGSVGFFGAQPTTKPTVAGSTGGNAALASLLNALTSLGLINNSTIA